MEIKRISILILASLLSLPLVLFAQEEEEKEKKGFSRIEMIQKEKEEKLENISPRQKYKLGKKLEKRGSNYNAIEYYEEFHQDKPDKDKAIHKLADLNFELRDFKAAQKWYELLLEKGADKYPYTNLYYGLTLKHNGEYEKAKTALAEFKKLYAGKDEEKYKNLAEREIEGCDLALSIISDPDRVNLENAGDEVNNPYSDFGPEFYGDGDLLFSSIRSDSAVAINQMAEKDADYRSKIFISENKGGAWQEIEALKEPLNTIDYHYGNPSLTADGNKMYFTKCETPKRKIDLECEIFVTEKKDGKWQEPKRLGDNINQKKSSDTHPAITQTEDGDYVLYFSSNREVDEGQGGKDIYYATSKDGLEFGEVKNAGPTINTTYDEVTPYYNSELKELYFSSNGRVGIGGFDIYKSQGDAGTTDFSEPEHLGYPINSSVDDLYFRIKPNERDGFLVSNRPGGFSLKSETCCDDIWQVTVIREVILKGYVASETDPKKQLPGADVNFFTVDGETLNPIGNVITKESGPFLLTMQPEQVYQINITKSGYFGAEERIDVNEIEAKDTLEMTFLLEEIEQREIKLKRIHFAFDRSNLNKKAKLSLDSVAIILLENEDFTMDVVGHTDSVGTLAYNMRLGKRRAQSAADYLVKKGVEVDRMSIISKGKTEPLVPNSNPDGTDNPENRAKNRRVEFIIHSNDPYLEIKVIYSDTNPEAAE
ncbi:MAG: OmpA family protein [Chitinophagales bacterium]